MQVFAPDNLTDSATASPVAAAPRGGRRGRRLAGEPWPAWRQVVAAMFVLYIGATTLAQTPSPPPDDEGLGKRLIRKAVNDSDEDVMAEVMRLMTESSRRLDIELDPGEETQAVQAEIMKQLDEAIQSAASRMRRTSQSRPQQQGDARKRPTQPKDAKNAKSKSDKPGAEVGEPSDEDSRTGRPAGSTEDLELLDTRRGWGNLPEREREEVRQGADEEYLDRFRVWIEQYYRALQEAEE